MFNTIRIIIGFIIFTLLIVIAILNSKKILRKILQIDNKTKIVLTIILLISLLIRIFLSPHSHVMFNDEPEYMKVAINIINLNETNYGKGIGWPILISPIFFIFGVNNYYPIYFNIFISITSLILFFFLVQEVTKNKKIAITSTLILSLFPAHIRWSTSAETTISSITLIILSLYFIFKHLNSTKNNKYNFIIAIILITFSSMIRIETIFLYLTLFIGMLYYKKINYKKIAIIAIAVLILTPEIYSIYTFQTNVYQFAGIDGEIHSFVLSNFFTRFKHGLVEFLSPTFFFSKFQPLIIGVLSLLGYVVATLNFKKNENLIILNSFFISVMVFYFSMGFNHFGDIGLYNKSRFYLNFHMITIISASIAVYFIGNKISKIIKLKKRKYIEFILIIIVALSFIPNLMILDRNLTGGGVVLKTILPEFTKENIPEDYIIVLNEPITLVTTNHNKIRTDNFLTEDYTYKNKKYVFLEDENCGDYYISERFEMVFENAMKNCNYIRNNYELELLTFIEYRDMKFNYYKIILT